MISSICKLYRRHPTKIYARSVSIAWYQRRKNLKKRQKDSLSNLNSPLK